jgi:hypothetical protein
MGHAERQTESLAQFAAQLAYPVSLGIGAPAISLQSSRSQRDGANQQRRERAQADQITG